MRIVEQSAELLWITPNPEAAIELASRTCYKSEDKITPESATKMVASLLKRGHEAMIEHACASVKVVTCRGISHECVRHRLFSYAQESTRFVDYGKADEIAVVKPLGMSAEQEASWAAACRSAEIGYFEMRKHGAPRKWRVTSSLPASRLNWLSLEISVNFATFSSSVYSAQRASRTPR